MSSRSRKDRPGGIAASAGYSEETHLWQQVKSHINAVERCAQQGKALEKEAQDDQRGSAGSHVADAVRSAWLKVADKAAEELAAVDRALESLGILTALRNSSEDNVELKRKKRRIESSITPPPSAPRGMSPTNTVRSVESSSSVAGSDALATPKRPATSASTPKGEKPPTSRRNTNPIIKESDKMDPARARREALAHQLPLSKGRKVAFRQPNKAKGGGSSHAGANNPQPPVITGDEEGETWIMAVITECINNDRNRYVVQDAEDPSTPTFNTTLKAIVPLPETVQTLPERDYPPGSQVMALYPDTSCFYRALVKGGGPKLENLSRKQREKRQHELLNAKYLLEFEDDGGDIKHVPAYLVVERP
ncbi:unnamed protein product [Parajaminaea phylloscopi]